MLRRVLFLIFILISFTSVYSDNATQIWNRTVGSVSYGYEVDLDSSLNVIVAGIHSPTDIDWLLTKYNSSGDLVWNRTDDPGTSDYLRGVAVDSNDEIISVGYINTGNQDWRIMKHNTSGESEWNVTYTGGAGGSDLAYAVDTDSSNNIYVAGTVLQANLDYMIIKYDEDGTLLWNNTINEVGNGGDVAYAVHVANDNEIYANGNADTGPTFDMYTVKYNSSGDVQWSATYNRGSDENGYGVAVDSNGDVYAAGSSYDGSNYDIVLVKYNSTGSQLWNISINANGSAHGNGIAIDSSDDIYITSYMHNGVSNEMVTFKFDSDGIQDYNITYDTVGSDVGNGVAVDSSFNLYITGHSSDSLHIFKYLQNISSTPSLSTTTTSGGLFPLVNPIVIILLVIVLFSTINLNRKVE